MSAQAQSISTAAVAPISFDVASLSSIITPAGVPRNWSRTIVSDLVLLLTVAASAGFLHAALALLPAQPGGVAAVYGTLLALLFFAFRSSLDVFSTTARKTAVPLLGAIALALTLSLPVGAQEPLLFVATPAMSIVLLAIASCAPLCLHRLAAHVLSRPALQSRFCRRVAIFGATQDSLAVYKALEDSDPGYSFAGLFDDRRSQKRLDNSVTPICGSLATLVRMVQSGSVDEVIICLPREASKRAREVAETMRGYPVNVHVVAHFIEKNGVAPTDAGSVRAVGNAVLVQIHTKPIRDWNLVLKEGLDRIGAAVLLIGLSPFFALIAGAIKLDSRGPVFFRQRRHGLMGQTIVVWKFRTMSCTEDGATVQQAQKHDPRVTKVGRILRKTSLDELPQLINVLLGEMSLVGPRPHAIAHNEYYDALIARYGHRNQVKPGITGWAQVNGLRGETRDTAHMAARVEYDLHYIRNWSIWFDIKVLFLTPIYGFVNRNAY